MLRLEVGAEQSSMTERDLQKLNTQLLEKMYEDFRKLYRVWQMLNICF